MIFNCEVNPTHYKYMPLSVCTTLLMSTRVAEHVSGHYGIKLYS